MQTGIFDRIRVVDVDTQVSKPYDLWTSRVWADLPEETTRKVFHDNAARIYQLD